VDERKQILLSIGFPMAHLSISTPPTPGLDEMRRERGWGGGGCSQLFPGWWHECRLWWSSLGRARVVCHRGAPAGTNCPRPSTGRDFGKAREFGLPRESLWPLGQITCNATRMSGNQLPGFLTTWDRSLADGLWQICTVLSGGVYDCGREKWKQRNS
jgi:hypothetical protein